MSTALPSLAPSILNYNLTSKERLDLKKLVNESECENNTQSIRELKHSKKILGDVCILEKMKRERPVSLSMEDFITECSQKAEFLHIHYPDIFHKVLKDEIDLRILSQLLRVLNMIEEGQVDQHEGSAMVGKILKEMYIDSAVRHGDNLDKEHEHEKVKKENGRRINWLQYKALQSSKKEKKE
jgi:hypothetical protein